MPFVYLLRCHDGSLYTGIAKNLARRLGQHEAGTASKYTRSRRPLTLVWSRRVRTWRRALQLEARIKQRTRAEKLLLVAGTRRRFCRRPRPAELLDLAGRAVRLSRSGR